MQNQKFIKELSFYAVALVLAVLPFNILVSWGIVLFLVATLFSCWNKTGALRLKQNKVVLYFVLPYFIYVLGLLYTENMHQGWKELEYKLSFLLVPLAVAALPKFKKIKLELLYKILLTSTLLSSIYCLLVAFLNNGFSTIPTYSDLSLHHHPTYLSLYVNVGIVIATYFFRMSYMKGWMLWLMSYLVFFNFLLNSKIGILFSVLYLLFFSLSYLSNKLSVKLIQASILIVLVFITLKFVPQVSARFESLLTIDFTKKIDPKSPESSALRILIWSQAKEIIRENPIVGVGTGDTKDELMVKYDQNGIIYAYEGKLNTHNQFFEWLVTFGAIGGVVFLFCFSKIVCVSWSQLNSIYIIFTVLLFSYMAVEAMFENESGIVFITLIHALFFFQPLKVEPIK